MTHNRTKLLVLGVPAVVLGGVIAFTIFSARAARENASEVSEPISRIQVANSPVVGEITYADAATLPGSNWPRLFGPQGNSIVEYPGELVDWPQAGPPVVWRKPTGQGYSAPVVQDGKLVLFHRVQDEERIECWDAESGQVLWSFAYPTAYESPVAPTYSEGPYSTPAIVGDRVYAIGAEAKLHCLSMANGDPLWSRDLKVEFELADMNYGQQEFYGFCPSPVPCGDMLIVNVGGREQTAGVVAFDQHTGETLWQATNDGASYATPTLAEIDGEPVAIVLSRDALVVLKPADGSVLFREEFRSKNPDTTNATSPVVVGETVFACGYGVGAMAINLRGKISNDATTCASPVAPQPEIVWRERRSLDAQYTNLLALGETIIGYPSRWRGTLMAVELQTGKVKWKLATDYARGNGVFINGEWIVLSEEGDLLRFGKLPNEPVLTAVSEAYLTGPCYTGPTFAAGRMYLRTERELVCVQLF